MCTSEKPTYDDLERDGKLYRKLLELVEVPSIEPFLRDALSLLVEVSGARLGYLEVRSKHAQRDESWWTASDVNGSRLESIRGAISRGIIAEALARGETLNIPSAVLDPRFSSRDSVQRHAIEAVLCLPIDAGTAHAALYLEGAKDTNGSGSPRRFAAQNVARAELFARLVAPVLQSRIDDLHAPGASDPSRAIRQRLDLAGIVGQSRAITKTLEQVGFAAPFNVNVLLTGEAGTGKTEIAGIIHRNSPRANGPFVHLNCAALPDELVESELFGACVGAHSTANRPVVGKVAAATNGTLFLDEIAELSLPSQAKILQLIDKRTYFPLGSAVPVHADVRVLAATNMDLAQAVAEKRFRSDLFFRLNVFAIRVPSLAERREDIPDLARHFCVVACERHGLPSIRMSPDSLTALERAEWPGNVRELAFSVESAVIRAVGSGAARVEPPHLFPSAEREPSAEDGPAAYHEATKRFQRQLLEDTLRNTEWNVSEAARRLELGRAQVHNLINRFGLKRHE